MQHPDSRCHPSPGHSPIHRQIEVVSVAMTVSTAMVDRRTRARRLQRCRGRMLVCVIVGRCRTVRDLVVVFVVMDVFDDDPAPVAVATNLSQAGECALENKHPAAPETNGTSVPPQVPQHRDAESDQGRSDDTTHPFVERLRD